MRTTRRLLSAAALAAAALTLLGPAEAKSRKEEGLRYATSYAAAWQEARARNALIFATFHKDN